MTPPALVDRTAEGPSSTRTPPGAVPGIGHGSHPRSCPDVSDNLWALTD
ncbi:hypothetical protein QJS66_07165 [Kocuria rhizophila]|nr:hypothetical protein QJS66_07165 [Kocuria rhizophila]